MLGLRWRHVDFLRRRVHVAETLLDIEGHVSFGPPKTRAAVRTVPLPSFVCEALSRVADRGIDRDTVPCSGHRRAARFGLHTFDAVSGTRP